MAFQRLVFRPGINTQFTPTLNEGGWSESNLIRFREGVPEVIGGWTPFLSEALEGACRQIHPWTTLDGVQSLGAGTSARLYVCQGGAPYDVTPVASSATLTNPFDTINTDPIVVVNDAAHGQIVGNYLIISGGSAVGGLTLSGEYQIVAVLNANSYTINAGTPATSSVTGGGGTPTIEYLLMPGSANQTLAAGFGGGLYGAGTYGTPRASSVGIRFPAMWTLDNWGEVLVANLRDGGIYAWLPASGLNVRATLITGAPDVAKAILVSAPAQQLIALGSSPAAGGSQDPMLVSWCNSSDYNTWIAASGNNAGSYRLTDGSQIMNGYRAAQQILIFTDTALFSMQFQAGPFVYGFQQLGTSCGLIAPNAAAVVNGQAFWMSGLNFMQYTGTVSMLDCPVRDVVYGNLNTSQTGKIFAGVNSQFGEVWWFYPSAGSEENDSYVVYNYAERSWYYGSIERLCWCDASSLGNPIAVDGSGNVWFQEVAYSANGEAMPFAIQSGYVDIAEGEDFVFLDQVIPDFVLTNGPIALTIYAKRTPNETAVAIGPFQVNATTPYLSVRLRGRQMAIRIDNSFSAPNAFMRLGAIRTRVAQDGRR